MAKRATLEFGAIVWFTHKDVQTVGVVDAVRNDFVIVKLPCGKKMKGTPDRFRPETVAKAVLNIAPVWSVASLRQLPKRGVGAYKVTLRLNGVTVLSLEVFNGRVDMSPDPHAPAGIALTFHRWLKRWYGETSDFVSALESWLEHRLHHADTPLEDFLARRAAALDLVVEAAMNESEAA